MQVTKNEIIHVALKDLYPSNNNVRGFMDEGNIIDLMNSIAQVGLLTPLIVQELGDVEGGFVVVAGHRRLEALTRLHSDDWLVPVLVRNDFDDRAITQVMLIENLQREDLSPLDEAKAFKSLLESGLNQTEIADKIGRSQSFVSQRLNLLTLPDDVRSLLADKVIKLSDAVQMIGISEESLKPLVKKALKAEDSFSFSSWDIDGARRADARALDKKIVDEFKSRYTVLDSRPDFGIEVIAVMATDQLASYMPSDNDVLYQSYNGIVVAERTAESEDGVDPWDTYHDERNRVRKINHDAMINYKLAAKMIVKSLIADKTHAARQPMLRGAIRSLVDEMYDAQSSVQDMLGIDFEDDDDAWEKWLDVSSENVIQALLFVMYESNELDSVITPILAEQGLEMPAMLDMPEPPEEDEDDEDLEYEND
jgi:ParB family transcriptional regulator, chromosome partitioning protein